MRLFRKQRKGVRISGDITAMDGNVIARRGDVVDEEYLQQVASIRKPGDHSPALLKDTKVFENLVTLIDKPKYHFITNRGSKRAQLLELLSSIRLDAIIIEELLWMDRFDYHHHHSLAVAMLVTRMMMDYFHDEERARAAASCAITHDVGITRVPAEILTKVSALQQEEKEILYEHPMYSYLLLTYYFGDQECLNAQVAYGHHENPLGTGYPRGIEQDDVICHCINLCDAYDALISSRPFRPALTPDAALSIVSRKVASGELDPLGYTLLNAYLQHID